MTRLARSEERKETSSAMMAGIVSASERMAPVHGLHPRERSRDLTSCGSRGCLETLVSGPALAVAGRALITENRAPHLRELVAGDPGKVTATQMALAADRGDIAVAEAIRVA